jgi:hypothetical protein
MCSLYDDFQNIAELRGLTGLISSVIDQKKFFALRLEKVGGDETLHTGKDQMLDLMLQLSLCGATKDAFPSLVKVANAQQYKFVTLVVPRKKLRVLERLGGAPGIHLDICKGKNNNLFFSIDCFFGRIKQNLDGSWGKVTEDESGWAGSSDLIVTTPVLSQLLENGDWDAALLVTMSIHCAFYMDTLGPELCIYMTSSTDKRHLHTSNFPPGISQEQFQPDLNRDMAALSLEQDRPVMISTSQSKGPLVLQAKYSVEKDSEEAILLGEAAYVTLVDITPCSILLKIGENHSRRIVFPYLIDGDKAKTRIARKSLWIEVTVPAAVECCRRIGHINHLANTWKRAKYLYRQRHGRALFAAVEKARTSRTSHPSLSSKNSNVLLYELQFQCSWLFLMLKLWIRGRPVPFDFR